MARLISACRRDCAEMTRSRLVPRPLAVAVARPTVDARREVALLAGHVAAASQHADGAPRAR